MGNACSFWLLFVQLLEFVEHHTFLCVSTGNVAGMFLTGTVHHLLPSYIFVKIVFLYRIYIECFPLVLFSVILCIMVIPIVIIFVIGMQAVQATLYGRMLAYSA